MIDGAERSQAALEADRLQSKVVNRSRVFQYWGLTALLVIGIWIAAAQGVRDVFIIVSTIAWAVFVLHHNFTQVLHELYELNDQIAGRKDEFRSVLRG